MPPSFPVSVMTSAPAATSPAGLLYDAIGRPIPPRDDPAWQPPRDPLQGTDVRARADVVTREIPLVSVATGWDVPSVRSAYDQLVIGLFDRPAQLIDSLAGDSRVQAGMASRTGGLLGRPVDFLLPRSMRDSSAARECRDAFIDAWPVMAAEPILSEIQHWAVMIGFGVAQILWDTSGLYAIPHPRPWHPRFTYYHWIFRVLVAITMDGQEPVTPGDGHWLLHAPHGAYRGWMRGAMRAIAPWWLARNYALRDWARYSERHGLPIVRAKTPAVGDPLQQAQFRASLARLGQETVLHLPQNVDPRFSYDVDLLEAKDSAHEGFRMLIQACDMEITLSLLAQNLTTEVKEGSYAAARVHADVRQSLLEADARALALTIYTQLARPFAAMNFGNPDLAPRVIWNVQPYEDNLTAVQTFSAFAQAVLSLRNAGWALEDVERLAKDFGVDLGAVKEVPSAVGKVGSAGAPSMSKGDARSLARALRFDPAVGMRVAAPSRLRFAIDPGDESEELREALAIAEASKAERGSTGRTRRA